MGMLLHILVALFAGAFCDDSSHLYQEGETVKLWVNKVGPYHNPQETYAYFMLPFCSSSDPETLERKWGGLGEVLEGNDLVNSGIQIVYKKDVMEHTKLCSVQVTKDIAEQFQYAVANHYWYQLYLDELPIWGMVGELAPQDESANSDPEKAEALIYTHKKFSIAYNKEKIIQVNLTSENPVTIAEGTSLDFTYSIEWEDSKIPFHKRFERYLDYDFFEHQIHWFSIFNSFMMVIFLTGIVSLILMRTLRKDYAKYAREAGDLDDLDQDLDESGWKQVHGDVFRPPPQSIFFAALVGIGSQLFCLVFLVILFATVATLYIGRGAVMSTFIVCYALTSIVAGYCGGSLYSRMGGRNWIKCMVYCAVLFPGACFSIALSLNLIAIMYKSLAAVPVGSVVAVLLIWLFVAAPLTLIGTILGRNWAGAADHPCRVNAIPRLIPDKRWYARPPVLIALGGVLPFGSIFIEMYFVFTSFWNYKFYYVYGFMLLVYIILIIVTICVTIVVTYFLLNNEDYRWPWTSFLSAFSTAIYVFFYSVYYFFVKTKMSGFFQTCFYFGYMSMFCLGLGIMCGAIGYMGCSMFVSRIYWNIKSD